MEAPTLHGLDPKALGAQLQDARRACDLTQQQVANKLGIARTTIVALEKGERRLSPADLVALCRLYGRSISDFVRPQKTSEDFLPQFRTVRGLQQSSAVYQAAIDLERMAKNYVDLERATGQSLIQRYPAVVALDQISVPLEQAAEDLAIQERNRLGMGDGPIPDLRTRLESDVGLRIFCFPMESKIAGLFGYTEPLGGCIGVNSRHPLERRRWSLAHEYGHFLSTRFRADYDILSRSGGRSAAEKFVDHFARHFLMPSSGLNRHTSQLHGTKSGLTLADVCTLADLFKVSVQALTLRLEELGRIKAGTWEHLCERGFKARAAKEYLGLNVQDDIEGRYSARYLGLAALAHQKGFLTEGELTERLGKDRVSTRKFLQDYWQRLVTETEQGFGRFDASLDYVVS
ncbi:MAG: hypothetical protein QOH88_1737 [Verrucomicrobiota bacterium]|jgi:Zn-dependent peptidase ImmA (M78 family)/DNA-binding XRE family transcriptional regulator